MFTREVVGTANAVVVGWGNLGGGVTQLFMGSVLFPLFKIGMTADAAWRTVCLVPAVITFCVGVLAIFYSEDAPKGNFGEMKKNGTREQASFRKHHWEVSVLENALGFDTIFG
jgi:NNP family nitrate/nitrite transporter-like MFS transporter